MVYNAARITLSERGRAGIAARLAIPVEKPAPCCRRADFSLAIMRCCRASDWASGLTAMLRPASSPAFLPNVPLLGAQRYG